MHNADKYKEQTGKNYVTLNNATLTGKQNCVLPEIAHLSIVDLAVLLIKADVGMDINPQLLKLRELN